MLLGLLLCTLALASAVWNIAQKAHESATLKQEAQAQLTDLLQRKVQLSADIEKLKTDRGKEEALRQQYALAAAGERLIVIVDPATQTPVVASTSPVMEWVHNFLWW